MKLFFEDEGRFGRSNTISHCWSPIGERPKVKKQIVRQYTYVYASVCPETGETFSLILPWSNTELYNVYLSELSAEYIRYRIILCTDNAGWHISQSLEIPENIVFLYLPPYSPQLNPVEHIWDYAREAKGFNNRIFNSIDEVTESLANVFNEIYHENDIIKSLCNFKWLYQ